MSKNPVTPAQYLKDRAPELGTDIAALLKAYAKKKNLPDSEIFSVVGDYWANQPSCDGSITDMVRIWYLCTSGLLNDEEIDDLHNWFFN